MPGYCSVLLISVYLLKATFSVCGIVCEWKLLSVLVIKKQQQRHVTIMF